MDYWYIFLVLISIVFYSYWFMDPPNGGLTI